MKEKAIIWGIGNRGKAAFWQLKDVYDIVCFIDSDISKCKELYEDRKIFPPNILAEHTEEKLIIASMYWNEIIKEVKKYRSSNITVFDAENEEIMDLSVAEKLDDRTIKLKNVFKEPIFMKELTFISGGSSVLDYAFIKTVAKEIHCKKYLEIGTFIGESINILTDICEELYSITLPEGSDMKEFFDIMRLPNYTNRLVYSDKIKQYFADSKSFDYSILPKDIDLFFIDGDHSYQGVYNDTKNIFSIKNEDAVVIWHDFKFASPRKYRADVIKAVKDVLGDEFENVYVTDNNICGIYLPSRLRDKWIDRDVLSENDTALFAYDITIQAKEK